MFFNISNHPSTSWGVNQSRAAVALSGKIIDIRFPWVDPEATSLVVVKEAQKVLQKVCEKCDQPGMNYVHIMGEMGMTFTLVSMFRNLDSYGKFIPVHSTSVRATDGKGPFIFVAFREYVEG